VVKNPPANEGDMGSISGSGRSPEGGNSNTPVFLPGKSLGQRSLVGYSRWGGKESDTTERLNNRKLSLSYSSPLATANLFSKSVSLFLFGAVVKTWHFQSRRHRFDPWSGV